MESNQPCPCGEYTTQDQLTKFAPFNWHESNYSPMSPAGLDEKGINCSSCKYFVEGSLYKYEDSVYSDISSSSNHCHILIDYINDNGLCRFWSSNTQEFSETQESNLQEEIKLELDLHNLTINKNKVNEE